MKSKPARSPIRLINRLIAPAANGPPRSVSNMKAPVVLRCSSRSARNSAPGIGWAAGARFFALRTCSVGLRPHSTWDHSSPAISLARRPCCSPLQDGKRDACAAQSGNRAVRLTHGLIGANKQRGGDDPSLGVRSAVKCKEILNQAPK